MTKWSLVALALLTWHDIAMADQSVLASNEPVLQTCTSAPVKALRFFEVGEARLARNNCQADDLLSPPLKLTFAYDRAIPGNAMSKAAMVMLQRNLSESQFNELAPRLRAFSSAYRDIDQGDAYHIQLSANGEVSLWLNEERLKTEQGLEFARAYMSIWFGPRPYSEDLKQSLLAQSTR